MNSTAEYVVFLLAVAVVLVVLRPHLPAWAVFVLSSAFTLFWLERLMDDGPRLEEVALLIVGVAAAAHVWWRDLRGTRSGGASAGTRTKPP